MALSFIGKSISLISHSDVRYRGILAGIDPAASTIQLSNVYSMGTESRRPPAEFIPPVQEPYQYIIFRASEVKDLAVDEPAPMRSVHDDPAVLGASAPADNPAFSPYPASANPTIQSTANVQQQPQQPLALPQTYAAASAPHPAPQPVPPPAQAQIQAQVQATPAATPPVRPSVQGRRTNSVHTAAASLETVERAIGDLRVSTANATASTTPVPTNNHHQPRGGRRARGAAPPAQLPQIKVPATDFDFEESNAKFDKTAMTPRSATAAGKEGDAGEEAEKEAEKSQEKEKEEKEALTAYNPQKSFFDSLSSSTAALLPNGSGNGGGGGGARGGRRGGARGGNGMARNRREEERERNVATFGEPGGVGLMGPGAYVGGWGGYGRRGGRPRRGGAGGGGGPVHQEVSTRV